MRAFASTPSPGAARIKRGDDRQSAASAVILAGGRSSRMGRDKASLPFGGVTILERIVGELARHFDELIVAAGAAMPDAVPPPRGLPPNVTLLHDDAPYQGPVGALARGIALAHHPIVFACSCDLPLLNGAVAHALCVTLDGYDAVIPEVD
ncbi:MAG TPA: molybdenum cofactor guanylyltransferase, partial [Candidatus Binataceae bacterium]|nr:molybdenum cofactor guanylyltransferase [Candidatus Binataceae bacterium]